MHIYNISKVEIRIPGRCMKVLHYLRIAQLSPWQFLDLFTQFSFNFIVFSIKGHLYFTDLNLNIRFPE